MSVKSKISQRKTDEMNHHPYRYGMDFITPSLLTKIATEVQRSSIPTYLCEDAESYVMLSIVDSVAQGKELAPLVTSIAIKRRIADFLREENGISARTTSAIKEARTAQAELEQQLGQSVPLDTRGSKTVTRVINHHEPIPLSYLDTDFSDRETENFEDAIDLAEGVQRVIADLVEQGKITKEELSLLSMRYVDDLPIAEIAMRVGLNQSTIIRKLSSVRGTLRESVSLQAIEKGGN
jgi:DNA-directed RNA polymerase specialized sigma24 family protein